MFQFEIWMNSYCNIVCGQDMRWFFVCQGPRRERGCYHFFGNYKESVGTNKKAFLAPPLWVTCLPHHFQSSSAVPVCSRPKKYLPRINSYTWQCLRVFQNFVKYSQYYILSKIFLTNTSKSCENVTGRFCWKMPHEQGFARVPAYRWHIARPVLGNWTKN